MHKILQTFIRGKMLREKQLLLYYYNCFRKKSSNENFTHQKFQPPPKNVSIKNQSIHYSNYRSCLITLHQSDCWIVTKGTRSSTLSKHYPKLCRGNGILASSMFPCFPFFHLNFQHRLEKILPGALPLNMLSSFLPLCTPQHFEFCKLERRRKLVSVNEWGGFCCLFANGHTTSQKYHKVLTGWFPESLVTAYCLYSATVILVSL